MTTSTLVAPLVVPAGKTTVIWDGPVKRYQLLVGKHYQTVKVQNPDGSIYYSEREFSAHDATCNIIETDIDLEERYNQQGFSEKFRRLPDPEQAIKAFDDDAFLNEAVQRGLLTPEEAAKRKQDAKQQTLIAPAASTTPTGKVVETKKQIHPALATLDTIPEIGLRKLAEDEEIDVTACKGIDQLRQTIRKHLKG